MSADWGPQCTVPSPFRRTYSGTITLCESLDKDLLHQELVGLDMPTDVVRVENSWYYRHVNSESWLSIGESEDTENGFPVKWDTSLLPNGRYEVIALMRVVTREGITEKTIARPNFTEVVVRNTQSLH